MKKLFYFAASILMIVNLSAIAIADSINREIDKTDLKACMIYSDVAAQVQQFRFFEQTEQYDFWYKHGEVFKNYNSDEVDRIMRHVYSDVLENTHPASVKQNFNMMCLNYRVQQKPEVAYRI